MTDTIKTYETLPPIVYDVNIAQIAKLKEKYMPLVITDLADKEQLEAIKAGRMVMVKIRTTIEKARVKQKTSALKYGRDVDAAAKELFDASTPIEAHLQAEADKVTRELERIKAEEDRIEKAKIQERVDTLFSFNVLLPYMDVATMDDESYIGLLEVSKEKYALEQKRIDDEEAARILKDKELAKAQAEIDRQAVKQAKKDKEQAAKEEAFTLKVAAFEKKEKEAAEKKISDAAAVKANFDAKVQAEKDEKERVKREAQEAKDKEIADKAEAIRQEALKPDREKLIAWVALFNTTNLPQPQLKSKEAKEIQSIALADIEIILQQVLKHIEVM